MTRPTATGSPIAQRVALCMLASVLLLEVGCVSRRVYDKVKADTVEQTQALETVREEVKELDREIAGWQASNRREDAAVSELRAAIQREEEQLPVMRQQAEDTLSFLKTQVATLMNQSWHLARKIADIRQESTSLQAKVAQYKDEMEQPRSSVMVAAETEKPVLTQTLISEESISESPLAIEPSPDGEPTQVAQAASPAPNHTPVTSSVSSPSVKVDPPSTNDSWIAMILSWLSAFWKWLLS
ncbi:MAG: hypothetical protein A4E19_13120 [Nitrospira sp. SG-bin1]|nr:MAG: hypothetical protein A4E19_13120 [Nitrospira sp. SG-bin1]